MLERDADQVAFSEGRMVCGFQEALEVMNRVNVRRCGASNDHSHRNSEGEDDCHAGGTQLHAVGYQMVVSMAYDALARQ
jgi:hypothetical protein